MPAKGAGGKPRGRMTSYACFVQICRQEHRKKNPEEKIVFAEFTKKCAYKWKSMSASEKRKFEEMAEKDKKRYEAEMLNWKPPPGEKKGSRKRTKDPNAPKRALSAFFFFCADERKNVRAVHPDWSVAEVAKYLGKQWEKCPNKPKYDAQAQDDKKRYERELSAYKQGIPICSLQQQQQQQPQQMQQQFQQQIQQTSKSAAAMAPPKKQKQEESEEEDEDEEDDDDEEEEESEEEDDE